jgi:SNF2 family DNA or RNA helicase
LIIDHILQHKRVAVWAGMGLGKTAATLTAINEMALSRPALVVAPLRVAATVWPDEIYEWPHLRHLRVLPILGTPAQRAKAASTPADVYTINYENLPWLIEFWGERWPYRTVVLDESTRVKSFRLRQGSVRAQAFARVAHLHVDRLIELTGTPSPNGLQDLWGQIWFLDRGLRLGRSYEAFKNRWFRSVQVGPDPFAIRLEPYPHSAREITERVADLCISLNPADWFDLREPIVNTIRVELPPAAMALYEQMEEEMFIELESDAEVEAFNAASKTMKCLQLASGAIYTDDKGTWEEVHQEKIEALRSVIEEAAGAPVLVAYHFKSDLARLLKAFPQGRVLDRAPSTIEAWNKGKLPVMFAHPASAGHGLNLQYGGNILVIFSHWWNLEEYQQIIERIGPVRQKQAGLDRPVWIHNIVARDTIDEVVVRRRGSKASVQAALLEYAKNEQHAA